MTVSTTPRRPVSGRGPKAPLKSPLAVPSAVPSSAAEGLGAVLTGVVLTDRGATISDFKDYLRTVNNRDGRPYEEKTIENYVGPCRNLDTWMTANGIDGDFTVLDAATLNRYAAPKGRPKTLSADFVDELLEVTGGGRARDFETARDHAIIRILRSEGIRRAELLGMVMHTLPADVIKNPVFRLVPLKGARAVGEAAWWCSPQPAPASWRSTCVPAATIHSPTRTGYGSVPAHEDGLGIPASGRC